MRPNNPLLSPPKAPCANCGLRPATTRWVPMGASIHGSFVWWCEVCVLKAQIAHARERAKALPGLEARLRELSDAA